MVGPDAIKYTTEVFQMLLPAFAVGAAIFRLRKISEIKPIVKTVQKGREHAVAVEEIDPESNDTFVGVPTGSTVHIVLEPGKNIIIPIDLRGKVNKPPKLLLAQGESRERSTIVDGITDTEIHDVEGAPSAQVRFLGSVPKNVLKQSLKRLFEKGLE